MSKSKGVKRVSKVKIVIAWILLIVSIVFALFLTYLKFYGESTTNDNITEHSASDSTLSPTVLETLETITKNFNDSPYIDSYQEEGISISANVLNDSIVIEYVEGDNEIDYNFNLNTTVLSIYVADTDVENFRKVFNILIYANQLRLAKIENINTINNKVSDFYNGTIVNGLDTKKEGENQMYSIDISKNILDDTTIQTTDNSITTSTAEGGV